MSDLLQRLPFLTNPLGQGGEEIHGIPVVPGDFPVIGHLLPLMQDRSGFLWACRERFGPLFWVRILGSPRLVWLEEESLELLMNKSTTSAGYRDTIPEAFGESIIVQDGSHHRQGRRILNPAFTPGGLGRAEVTTLVEEVIGRRLAGWRAGQVLSPLEETQAMALHVIFHIMGIPRERVKEWEELYRGSLRTLFPINSTFPGTPRWWGQRSMVKLDEKLAEVLREARAGGGESLVAQMAKGRDESGREMDEVEMVHNLRLLLLAGHETSASSMAWMLLHLAHEPELWSGLLASAEELVSGEAEIPSTPRGLRAYPYAEGLFREAVRLYPPAHTVPRRTTEAIEIRGHRLPAGTEVSFAAYALSHDPARYPEPERLLPERWIPKEGEGRLRPTAIETCQFGAGPHFCLGYHLAILEGSMLALTLAAELGRRGLLMRPTAEALPAPVHTPLTHPPASATIRIASAS